MALNRTEAASLSVLAASVVFGVVLSGCVRRAHHVESGGASLTHPC